MDDDGVKNATTLWTILKECKEIRMDIMQHKPEDSSPVLTDIKWHLQTQMVNYFDPQSWNINYFDPQFWNSTCRIHSAQGTCVIWVREKVQSNHPDHHNPDYLISADSVHYQCHSNK